MQFEWETIQVSCFRCIRVTQSEYELTLILSGGLFFQEGQQKWLERGKGKSRFHKKFFSSILRKG
jgi:hypothetical protein